MVREQDMGIWGKGFPGIRINGSKMPAWEKTCYVAGTVRRPAWPSASTAWPVLTDGEKAR